MEGTEHCMGEDVISECLQRVEGRFMPKEQHSIYIKQFRKISLLSVECKIFFSVVSKRLTNYMLADRYLDTSVQKGVHLESPVASNIPVFCRRK